MSELSPALQKVVDEEIAKAVPVIVQCSLSVMLETQSQLLGRQITIGDLLDRIAMSVTSHAQMLMATSEKLPNSNPTNLRCFHILKGERCGLELGHSGDHKWSNGD